jgi:hypothetical protein
MIRCLLATVGVLVGCSAAVAGPIFSGNFSGLQEVPPRVTQATGFGFVDFSDDLQSARVFAQVSNIQNVRLGHIHVAPAGANGPIVFDFLNLPPAGTLDVPGTAVLVDRVITGADLTGPFANNLPGFLNAALAGNLYFNIHTDDNQPGANTGPGDFIAGEVRGQLTLVPEPGTLLVFGLLGAGGAGLAVWRRRKAAG